MAEYDVFISYRRDGGDALSRLLYNELTRDGYRVFYDVETMRSGKFNEQILESIAASMTVLVVLPPHGLDRCSDPDDWVRQELEFAVSKKKMMIPVMMRGFEWEEDKLPDSLRELPHYQGIAANDNSLFSSWYARLKAYIDEQIGPRPVQKAPEERETDHEYALGLMSLEDGDPEQAEIIFDMMLKKDPLNAKAWLGKALIREKMSGEEDLTKAGHPLEESMEFKRALRFAGPELKARLEGYAETVKKRLEKKHLAEEKRQAEKKRAAEKRKPAEENQPVRERKKAEAGPRARPADDKPGYGTVGAYVRFGRYPQTAGGTDRTSIEWLVLDYDARNRRALLLSRYGLDAQKYNASYRGVTWEKCTLRGWLNGEFINKAFTLKEQSGIAVTLVDNGKGQGFDFTAVSREARKTVGGNNTEDRVFLLSCAEAGRYLGVTWEDSDNMKPRTAPTAYAGKKGASASDGDETPDGAAAGWWWLRSPGCNQDYAAQVSPDGSLSFRGVNYADGCVRPALWIDLNAGIF